MQIPSTLRIYFGVVLLTGVYAIYESGTDTCLYVGQSSDIESRWKQHVKNLKSGKALKDFCDWFIEVGCEEDSLDFVILELCENTDEAKNTSEIQWFKSLSPRFYGSVPSENNTWSHSESTKNAIRNTMLGKSRSRGLRALLICPTCGTTFETHTSSGRRYCDKSCRPVLVKSVGPRICSQCLEIFDTTSGRKTCSQTCRVELQRSKTSAASTARYPVIASISKESLVDLYVNQKLSLAKIAGIFDISRQTVYNKMKTFDIPRRDKNSHLK